MPDSRITAVWLRVLVSLSLVLLACAARNYLTFFARGTPLCPYLCPSLLGAESAFDYPFVGALYSAQRWLLDGLQAMVTSWTGDPFRLATGLLFAPLLEEVVYRGPMYLSRRMSTRYLWWFAGLLSTAVFTLSHGRSGLALLPLAVLGVCSLWLIARTQRFWPSLALHFLFNFFATSLVVYQSLWASD